MSKFQKQNKKCYLCATSMSLGEGTVPLCNPTKNKEFCGKSFYKAGSVILIDLIKSVGINVYTKSESDASLCKKCARKIVNCCDLFQKLQEGFRSKSAPSSRELSEVDNIDESSSGAKRLHSVNSPSGLTPGSKKQKENSIRKTGNERGVRKTLFELNSACSTRETVEDSVANLMCLPVEKPNSNDDYSSAVVKVSSTCELFYSLLFLVRLMFNFPGKKITARLFWWSKVYLSFILFAVINFRVQ